MSGPHNPYMDESIHRGSLGSARAIRLRKAGRGMLTDIGITEEMILAEAAGTLTEWLDGRYTELRENAPQQKITLEEIHDDGVTILVKGAAYTGEPDKRFRVTLRVEQLP